MCHDLLSGPEVPKFVLANLKYINSYYEKKNWCYLVYNFRTYFPPLGEVHQSAIFSNLNVLNSLPTLGMHLVIS